MDNQQPIKWHLYSELKILVNSKGEIYSTVHKGKRLKTTVHNGYEYLRLMRRKIHHTVLNFSVHYLVAKAFLPNPEDLPTVNHKDGNKINNQLNNLEWASYQRQMEHAKEKGLTNCYGSGHHRAILNEDKVWQILELLEKGESHPSIARKFGVARQTITNISVGHRWKDVVCRFRDHSERK